MDTKLTVEKLKAMKPGIFATGIGTYPEITGVEIRWVAVRGGCHDWTIYYLQSKYSAEYIRRHGDKMFTHLVIERLVPSDPGARVLYRY